jgi:hypothetical protein
MRAALRDWADPFLEQAKADLAAAWCLAGQDTDFYASTLCMLIQMVFEKLAKAAFARNGSGFARSHEAASRFFETLKRHPTSKAILAGAQNVEEFVGELELAHPTIAGNHTPPWPQLEYPWEDALSGTVRYPAKDLALARRAADPRCSIVNDCLRCASTLAQDLWTILP